MNALTKWCSYLTNDSTTEMRVFLVPCIGSSRKEPVRVTKSSFVIGRAADCDLQLASPLVSRHHCALVVKDGVRLRDLGSRNGTHVNEDRVADDHLLADGDLIRIATALYEVRIR